MGWLFIAAAASRKMPPARGARRKDWLTEAVYRPHRPYHTEHSHNSFSTTGLHWEQISPVSGLRISSGGEQVAAHLREGLLQGRWSGVMPGKNRLARELGVSGKIVVAALGQLERGGLLVGQGPSVAHIRWDYRPVLRRIVRWTNNIARGKEDRRQTSTKAEFVEGGTVGLAPKR